MSAYATNEGLVGVIYHKASGEDANKENCTKHKKEPLVKTSGPLPYIQIQLSLTIAFIHTFRSLETK